MSAVTDMQSMFADAKVFNQDLSNWNTASVANMQSMFGRAGAFDNNGVVVLPWNTASVTDMSYMFHGTSSLRALNALEWQTSLVQTMDSMFREASSFNADVSTWDTQAVTSMAYMFQGGASLPAPDSQPSRGPRTTSSTCGSCSQTRRSSTVTSRLGTPTPSRPWTQCSPTPSVSNATSPRGRRRRRAHEYV